MVYIKKHTKYILYIILLYIICFIYSLTHYVNANNNLNNLPIKTWLNHADINDNQVSISVAPANGGLPIITLNPTLPLNPASVMKLYTTYAALDLLGASYTFKTELLADKEILSLNKHQGILKGNIYIKGGGDPLLTQESVWRLLYELRLMGLSQIKGDIILDSNIFESDDNINDNHRFDGEGERPYNVLPNGLLMNFNATRFVFKPTLNEQQPSYWNIIADPLPLGWRLQAKVDSTTNKTVCNDWKQELHYRLIPNTNNQGGVIAINGHIPSICGEQTMYRVVDGHFAYQSGLIKTVLDSLGIMHQGTFKNDITPKGATLINSIDSLPVSTLIKDINKRSNNVMARMMFLNLSAYNNNKGSLQASRHRVYEWLKQVGLNDASLVFDNGSGLSRMDRANTQSLIALLQHVFTHAFMPEFISSLAVAGEDGTVNNRLSQLPKGVAHLKTGTLKDSTALAGYVQGRSGQYYAVSAIIQGNKTSQSRAVLDLLIDWIYNKG